MKKQKGYYKISAVAELFEITPQTLRLYDEKGLVCPSRSQGNKRLYDDNDLEKLELVLRLTRELGVNLAGVEVILNMREKMLDREKKFKEIVELLLKDFQDVMHRFDDQDEEGLILCSNRKLMKIKQHLAATGSDTDRIGALKPVENSNKGEN